MDWQSWAWNLFQWAIKQAPWPQSYNSYNATGYAWDHMSVPEWINQYMPGGTAGNFAAVCLQNVIDEYGGDPSDQSALNLTMILGYYDSKGPWVQGQYAPFPYSAGTDELYHITGGNDQIVNGLVDQLPAGTIKTGEALVAMVANSDGTYTLTFQSEGPASDGGQRRPRPSLQDPAERGPFEGRVLAAQEGGHQRPGHGNRR